MKVLFIGGTGNISADCASLLRERGHEISVITRGNIPVPAEYSAITADRKDADSMRKALCGESFDTVINFLGYIVPDLEIDFETLGGNIGQYIFISSTVVYAKPHTQLPLTETAPIGNLYSGYAKEKEKCEAWLTERSSSTGFPYTIVRPSHTYSNRWIPNTVSSKGYTVAARLEAGKPLFVPDDGENPWTLTATSDFAVGLAGLVGNEKALGETFHITSDEALSWNRIYSELADAVGAKDPELVKIPTDFLCEHFPDQASTHRGDKSNPAVFDNSKIKSFVPDFACQKPFRKGIRESVAYMRAHPEEQNINPEVDAKIDAIIKAFMRSEGCPTEKNTNSN